MNQIPSSARIALSRFIPADSISSIESLGNAGGFSGARLWRVSSSGTDWCLRRWPTEHPSRSQLTWIHGVLFRVARQGVNFLPLPSCQPDGSSYCQVDGAFWELAPWMPGKADFWDHPSNERLAAALQGLAEFHRATKHDASSRTETPPGILAREQQLEQWQQLLADPRLVSAMSHDLPFARQSSEITALMPAVMNRCRQSLASAPRQSALQPCLRDIWHDHVLFQDSRLSAFVDFGAMRLDTVAVDLARLLGSLVADDAAGWQLGLKAYQEVHPLADEDRAMLAAIDLANSVLSGANWIRWIFIEHRRFENVAGVQGRMDRILERLRFQANKTGPAL